MPKAGPVPSCPVPLWLHLRQLLHLPQTSFHALEARSAGPGCQWFISARQLPLTGAAPRPIWPAQANPQSLFPVWQSGKSSKPEILALRRGRALELISLEILKFWRPFLGVHHSPTSSFYLHNSGCLRCPLAGPGQSWVSEEAALYVSRWESCLCLTLETTLPWVTGLAWRGADERWGLWVRIIFCDSLVWREGDS